MEKYFNQFNVIEELTEKVIRETNVADHLVKPIKKYDKNNDQYVYAGFELMVKTDIEVKGIHQFSVLNAGAEMFNPGNYDRDKFEKQRFNEFSSVSGDYSIRNDGRSLIYENLYTYLEIYGKLMKLKHFSFGDRYFTSNDEMNDIIEMYIDKVFKSYSDNYNKDFKYDTITIKEKDSDKVNIRQFFIIKWDDENLIVFENNHYMGRLYNDDIFKKEAEQLLYIINESGSYIRIEDCNIFKKVLEETTRRNPNIGLQEFIWGVKINNTTIEDIYVDNKIIPDEVYDYYRSIDEDTIDIIAGILNPIYENNGNKFYRTKMEYTEKDYFSIIKNLKSKKRDIFIAKKITHALYDNRTSSQYDPVSVTGDIHYRCNLLYEDILGKIVETNNGIIKTYLCIEGYYVEYNISNDLDCEIFGNHAYELNDNYKVMQKLKEAK